MKDLTFRPLTSPKSTLSLPRQPTLKEIMDVKNITKTTVFVTPKFNVGTHGGNILIADCHFGKMGVKSNEDEAKANAELIAEAFNVANETGFSPRQLLEQRDELVERANSMLTMYELIAKYMPEYYSATEKERIVEAIQKTKKQ